MKAIVASLGLLCDFDGPLAWMDVVVHKLGVLQAQRVTCAMAHLAFEGTFGYFHDTKRATFCLKLCAVNRIVPVPGATSVLKISMRHARLENRHVQLAGSRNGSPCNKSRNTEKKCRDGLEGELHGRQWRRRRSWLEL